MKVRPATAADVPAVRDVAAAAWRDTYAGLLLAATIERFIERAYSVERLRQRIERDCFLVAEDERGIVAFVDAREEADRVTLYAFYAHPAARGRGAGTALLREIRARFPRLPIAADVLAGNRKGERFYERRGFVPEETFEEDLGVERAVERRWWLRPGE